MEQKIYFRKRELEEAGDEDTDEKGYIDCWRKLEGKNIKQGEVKLRLNWLQFKCDDNQHECAPDINKYFLGAFVNSVSNLPDAVRGRQVQATGSRLFYIYIYSHSGVSLHFQITKKSQVYALLAQKVAKLFRYNCTDLVDDWPKSVDYPKYIPMTL